MFYKLPKKFRDGLIDFWGDPSDGPEGLGNGVGGPSGTGSGPGGGGAEAGTMEGGWHGDLTGDTIDGNESPSSTVDDRGLADKALDAVLEAAKRGLTYGITQNKAAQALEGILNIAGLEVDFKDTVKGFLDDGYTPSEAASKASEAVQDALDKSSLDNGQKDEASEYLNILKTPEPAPEDDPSSFEFFINQFKETTEGKAILQDMYNGQATFATQQFDELKKAAAGSNSLLDDLIDQSKTGTGLFTPVSFMLEGQEISFVPKMNMARANNLIAMEQKKMDNALSQFGGGLALDKFKQDDYQFEQSGERTDRSLDQREPGWLDYIKAFGSFF